MTKEGIHEEIFHISAHDTDMKNKCKLTNICNYLQETAIRHVLQYGMDPYKWMDKGLAWVLSRMKIEMFEYPGWQDSLTIRTWCRGTKGLFVYRDYEIIDKNAKIIGKASSAWLIIDIERRRPLRPDAYLAEHDYNFVKDKISISEELSSLKEVKDEELIFSLPIRYSDVDMNHHVNNVKYARWQLDSLPNERISKEDIKGFEINFLHETKLGESVNMKLKQVGDNTYASSVDNGTQINSRAIIKF
jgi:acyl-ACP thioesterase